MKNLLLLLVLFCFHVSYAQHTKKALIFIKEESSQLEYMLSNEVIKMKEMLEASDFEVTTATISGKKLEAGTVSLTPDLKLKKVDIDDYDGFIIPCMVADNATEESVDFVKSIAEKDKPIAAQVASVYILAKAGILEGKKYALYADQSDKDDFKGSIYGGKGVVQDGMIITSGGCPWAEHNDRGIDRTVELTQSFMELVMADQ